MYRFVVFTMCIVCFVSACKPLAQRETVSEELGVAALTRKFDLAIQAGDFSLIRDWIATHIAKRRVKIMEKLLNRTLMRGRKAAVIALFDSYIDDDALRVNKTIASISRATSADDVRGYLKRITSQVYEVQAAWSRRTETISTFAKRDPSVSTSRMDNFSSEYSEVSGKYEDWATATESRLRQALRTYSDRGGRALPKDIDESFDKLQQRLHDPEMIEHNYWRLDNN